MKLFKKLAGACLALTLCFGAFGLVACGEKEDDTPAANSYKFQVLTAQNEAAVGYRVLLCQGEGCGIPQTTDENGYATVSGIALPVPDTAGEYDIHVMGPTSSDYLDFSGVKTTPVSFSSSVITLTLTA